MADVENLNDDGCIEQIEAHHIISGNILLFQFIRS